MILDNGSRKFLHPIETIIVEKTEELGRAASLRELIAELEPPYENLLYQWEIAFAKTLREARSLLQQAMFDSSSDGDDGFAPNIAWKERLIELASQAEYQTDEFNRHLGLLEKQSAAVWDSAAAQTLLSHVREASRADHEEDDSPDGYGGPRPADSPMRPEPGWSNPTGEAIPPPEGATLSVPIGGHRLPPLPYPYNALEPWIDEKTMRIHHDKHHKSYVDGLNAAELKLAEARRTGNFDLVKHWERELAFNGAGHYLHTLFWDVMSPRGGGKPTGELAADINRSFGSFEAFKKQFSEAAGKVEGGGWAILVWSPRSRRLEILTAEKHQNLSQWDVVPLLPLDVWEHAYYLKHQNDRAAYINDWWNVVNWPYVADRYARARQLQWAPY